VDVAQTDDALPVLTAGRDDAVGQNGDGLRTVPAGSVRDRFRFHFIIQQADKDMAADPEAFVLGDKLRMVMLSQFRHQETGRRLPVHVAAAEEDRAERIVQRRRRFADAQDRIHVMLVVHLFLIDVRQIKGQFIELRIVQQIAVLAHMQAVGDQMDLHVLRVAGVHQIIKLRMQQRIAASVQDHIVGQAADLAQCIRKEFRTDHARRARTLFRLIGHVFGNADDFNLYLVHFFSSKQIPDQEDDAAKPDGWFGDHFICCISAGKAGCLQKSESGSVSLHGAEPG
jgi:hypothetical protein